MTDFSDVERFGREHAGCGGITPTAAPEPGGGFVLKLTCACGADFTRPVTMEEAKQPLPLPQRAVTRAPRPAPAASAEMEAVMRAAVEAETESAPPPKAPEPRPTTPAPTRGDLDAVMRQALAAESRPAAPPAGRSAPPGPRPAVPPRPREPAKLNLDTTIRSALDQQAALRVKAGSGRAAPRTRVVWLVLFAIVAFGGAAMVYLAGMLDAPPEPPPVVSAPPAPAPPPGLDQRQRAALDEIMKSLRTLQAAATPNASLSLYSSRVTFAKSDVDRFIASTAPGPERAAVREVLAVHLLAVAAWTARTLDQKDNWEAVGQDPAIEICPSVKRVVDFSVQRDGASRAQTRGVAVASAIPLLWECAGAKIAAIDRGVNPPPPTAQ
jgi:hypothetical protein